MKPTYLKILGIALSLGVAASCSKDDNNNTESCNISYTDSGPLSVDQAVTYNAGKEGNGGTISSLSYLDSAGTTTVKNPTLPWVKVVNLKQGAIVTINAQGTANAGGKINIAAFADGVQSGVSCDN